MPRPRRRAGAAGVPIRAIANGERCARITAKTATPGTISRTTTRAAAPIAGARTGSRVSATIGCCWCLGLALWNGRDPILKERLFGLTNTEGNHGEDVKELYFYLDATPTHSYMRMLYKYPQVAFPYEQLRGGERAPRPERGASSSCSIPACSTAGRYFDVTVEYAKATPDDILMRITVVNRGSRTPHRCTCCRNSGRATSGRGRTGTAKPALRLADGAVEAAHPEMETLRLSIDRPRSWLFCENETNVRRLYGVPASGPFKDGINDYLVAGDAGAIRTDGGTKSAPHMSCPMWPPAARWCCGCGCGPRQASGAPFADFDTHLRRAPGRGG